MSKLLLLTMLFLLMSCEKNTKVDHDPLYDYWLETNTYAILHTNQTGDSLIYFSRVYDAIKDDYHNARIIKYKKNKAYLYTNSNGADYLTRNYVYDRTDTTLNFYEGNADNYIELNTYEIENDILTVQGSKKINSDVTVYSNIRYELYKGSIPPRSWLDTIPLDFNEGNNTVNTASEITLNSGELKQSLREFDRDYFKFEMKLDKKYLVKIISYIDIEIELYDTDQTSLLFSEDSQDDYDFVDGANIKAALLWEAKKLGTYYLKVSNVRDEEGYYWLTIEEY